MLFVLIDLCCLFFNKNSLSSGVHNSRDRCDNRCAAQVGKKMQVEDWMNSLLGYANVGSRCLLSIGKGLLACTKEISFF